MWRVGSDERLHLENFGLHRLAGRGRILPYHCVLPMTYRDITGERFGRLVAVKIASRTRSTRGESIINWLCRCDCGNEVAVRRSSLCGNTTSCGCKWPEAARKNGRLMKLHDMRGTPEWATWCSLRSRCVFGNPSVSPSYKSLKLTVCERWSKFVNFYQDMGPRPSPKHSIDRIDNSLGYSPDNCRWATHKEQSLNRRSTKFVMFRGETLCVADWARRLGILPPAMHERLRKWPVDRALTQPRRVR